MNEVFLIFLIVILIISVVLGVYPVITSVTHNKCIAQQHTLLQSFNRMIEYVEQKGVPITNKSFQVMQCTDCIWYDPLDSEWVIKHIREEQINKSISYRVVGVAQNCISCESPSVDVDGDGEPEKCANMVRGKVYDFTIGEDYVECTNCPLSPNLCENQILFGDKTEVGDSETGQLISVVSYNDLFFLFYKDSEDIYYRTSSDLINWNPAQKLTDKASELPAWGTYDDPAATVYNGELYLAYKSHMDINAKKCNGNACDTPTGWTDLGKIAPEDDSWANDPFLTVYDTKLHLVYRWSAKFGSGNNIRYTSYDGVWSPHIDVISKTTQATTNPSVAGYDGRLYVSYTQSAGTSILNIFVKSCETCDGTDWSDEISTSSVNENDHTRLIVYDGILYLFYTDAKSIDPPWQFGNIIYRSYDGEWKGICGVVGGKEPNFAAFPSPVVDSDNIYLCYLNYDSGWKIICM